jgi:hypothetical protein
MPQGRIFSGCLSWRTVMLSPSMTPTTLPDQAAAMEGRSNDQNATNHRIGPKFFTMPAILQLTPED